MDNIYQSSQVIELQNNFGSNIKVFQEIAVKSEKIKIQWCEQAGLPIHTAHGEIVPISRSLFIRFPFGGFVWNRPVAINFIRDGQNERVPIIDITRKVVLMIVSLGILIPAWIMIQAYFKNLKTKS